MNTLPIAMHFPARSFAIYYRVEHSSLVSLSVFVGDHRFPVAFWLPSALVAWDGVGSHLRLFTLPLSLRVSVGSNGRPH